MCRDYLFQRRRNERQANAHNAGKFQANHSDKQANPYSNCMFQGHWHALYEQLADPGNRQQNKNNTGNKNGAQSGLPRHTHADDNSKRIKCIQAHSRSHSDRIVNKQAHHNCNQTGSNGSGQQDGVFVHPCGAQNAGIDKQDISHSHKRSNPCGDFGIYIGVSFTQCK